MESPLLIETRPLHDLEHLSDHGAGQVALLGQLQPTGFDCTSQQDHRIAGDRRSREVCGGQAGFKPDRLVACRWSVVQRIEAAKLQHRPSRFDAVQPSADFGVFEKSWSNH